MEKYYYIVIGFILLIIMRFLLYINKYLYLRKVLRKQDTYIDGKYEGANVEKKKIASQKAGVWIKENQIELKKVVLKTGIQDQETLYMKPVGMGFAQEQIISTLDNFLLNPEIMVNATEIILRAKGFYKIQALKSFKPLFWIEFIVFLPKELLKYFGVDETPKGASVMMKVFQVIYWLASIFFMYHTYLKNIK
ncbi:MAG: hypothetical protein P4L35_17640 [Ignavibacteriaceae bacterium]|nr:hypothetical protein [Ignavibacteriaceae bacterium]